MRSSYLRTINLMLLVVLLLSLAVTTMSAQPLPLPQSPRGAQAGLPYALPPGHVVGRDPVYIVTTTADADESCNPGDGLTLREALLCAQEQGVATVYVPNGIYTLTEGVITSTVTNLTLVGEDAAGTIIEAAPDGITGQTSQLFELEVNGTVIIANLTVRNVEFTGFGGAFTFNGLSPDRVATVYNIVASGNSTTNGGSVIQANELGLNVIQSTFTENESGAAAGAVRLEATSASSTLTIQDSIFTDNAAECGGAAVVASFLGENSVMNVIDSTFDDNALSPGCISEIGGALIVSADGENLTLNVRGSGFDRNNADQGGAIAIFGTNHVLNITDSSFFDNRGVSMGGAVASLGAASVTIQDSSFTRNDVDAGDGGAVFLNPVGGGSVLVDGTSFATNTVTACALGGGALAVDFLDFGGTVTILDSRFTTNTAFASCTSGAGGGAVVVNNDANNTELTIRGTIFDRNNGGDSRGGALLTDGVGDALVADTVFTGNTTTGNGGGWFDNGSVELVMRDSVFVGNTATDYGAALLAPSVGSASVYRTTFAHNSALDDVGGVGIHAQSVYVEEISVVGNSAGDDTGGIQFDVDGLSPAVLVRSHIEDNTAADFPDCEVFVSGDDVITGLDGSTLSQPSATCALTSPDATSKNGNLIRNGTFANALVTNESLPEVWTAKNITGDKRQCNTAFDGVTPATTHTPYGWCAMEFKGGAGEKSQLSQTVDLIATPVTAGDVLLLSALAKAKGPVNLTVVAKVTYAVGSEKLKVKFDAATSGEFVEKVSTPLPVTGTPTAIKVAVKHKSAGGKTLLASVFMWIDPASLRNAAGDFVPPPGAPGGFRAP